ncbi:MAG: PEP-CTERM sorting domain-containing protein [Planctomycetes bacterium]|nr:PEP-CTERM sorting domain-containing protein [Planctomycetota bacterium]
MKRVSWVLAVLWLAAGEAWAGGIFGNSYSAAVTLPDALGSMTTGGATTMGIAFDGTHYWSAAGGYADAVEFAQYTGAGVLINTYNPQLDLRSVFTDGSGNVYVRAFDDATIYRQTSPGVFVSSGVVLAPNALNDQSAVVLNGPGTEYVAMFSGVVSRWDLDGNALGTVALVNFGSVGNEAGYPQNRGLAAARDYWLTYDGYGQTLSAWDFSGNVVGMTVLNDAGNSFDSNFSLSYANGLVFVVDVAGGTWRGYDVFGLADVAVPEPGSLAVFGISLIGIACLGRRRKPSLAAASCAH